MKRALKIVAIVLGIWVAVVVAFESLIGWFQPESGETLVITTYEDDGTAHERVLARLESGGEVYVAANHWPRAWYRRALDNPEVEVEYQDETTAYRAVPVSGAEHERVDDDNSLGLVFRILTGFPPRYFLRLEPREQGA